MVRPKGAGKKKPDANPIMTALLGALKYLEPAGQTITHKHCAIINKTATMFDGTVAMGTLVDTDIAANPDLNLMISALSKCKDETQITQLSPEMLSIQSGRLKVTIQCLATELITPAIPSPSVVVVNNETLRFALNAVSVIAKENAPRLIESSILLRNGSAVATNGIIIFEAWHGHNLPTMILPKRSVALLLKIAKPMTGFGCQYDTGGHFNSATFWFEDGSWFKTQLYVEDWPDVDRILNTPATLWPIPKGFWEGVEAVTDFIDDYSRVTLGGKIIKTAAASYEIDGALPATPVILNHEFLSLFAPHATQVDWLATETLVAFRGENFRGLLSKIKGE